MVMNAFAPYRGENAFAGIPAGNAFSTNTGKPVNAFDPRFNFLSKLGELGNTWYQRLIGEPLGAMDRVGGAMLGQNRYPIDEINDPATVRMKQAQDVLEGVGLYSGPNLFAKPSNTVLRTVDAWHGSPHKFDKMSTEKIGTGEGAQAFGWGIYLSDAQGVGKSYKPGIGKHEDRLRIKFKGLTEEENAAIPEQSRRNLYKTYFEEPEFLKTDIDAEISFLKSSSNKLFSGGKKEDAIAALERLKKTDSIEFDDQSSFYNAQIFPGKDPSQYRLIDWYEKIDAKTAKEVMSVALQSSEGVDGEAAKYFQRVAKTNIDEPFITTGNLYTILSKFFIEQLPEREQLTRAAITESQKKASLLLKSIGVDGIRYPADSIANATKVKSGGFNYVVFDDKDIKLVSRESGGVVDDLLKEK